MLLSKRSVVGSIPTAPARQKSRSVERLFCWNGSEAKTSNKEKAALGAALVKAFSKCGGGARGLIRRVADAHAAILEIVQHVVFEEERHSKDPVDAEDVAVAGEVEAAFHHARRPVECGWQPG